MSINRFILKFCAEECERQKSGELSVYHMAMAFEWMRGRGVNENILLGLAVKVEPEKNANGYRRIPVMIDNKQTGAPPQLIPQAMQNLLNNTKVLNPSEWYQEFESIHPFEDGNGRIGAIIFNIMSGSNSQIHPKHPPEFKV